MRNIRTLVVDDEPLARARIVNLLNKADNVSIIGECKNGREAMKAISTYKPDLVFLDIQMPDLNGFDVLNSGKLNEVPFIIFVTAFDQYALKAFDVKAVDYLLKPYDEERFYKALEHARTQISMKDAAVLHQKMVNLIEEQKMQNGEINDVVELKEKGRSILVRVEDLCYIEADGNYLRLHEIDSQHLLRETLQNFETRLEPSIFLRIHRSIIVNTNYIEKVSYKGNNQFQFSMKNGKRLLSSRGYREEIVKYLDEEALRKKVVR
jgi:two-component system LytT family response regulator